MASRSDTETRQASLLLSGLVLTPDSALEVFRDRRAADSDLDLEHLKRARDILDFVNTAITHAEPQRWERLKQAWELLNQPLDQPAAAPTPEARDGEPARPQRLDAPSSGPPSQQPAASDDDDDPTAQVPPMVPPPAHASVGLPPPAAPGRLPAAPTPVVGPPPSSPPPADNSPWAKASPPPAPTVDIERLNQIKVSDETGDAGKPNVPPAALPFRGSVAKPPPSALTDSHDGGGDPLMQTAYMEPPPRRATTLPFKAVPAAGVPAADGSGAGARADDAASLPAHLGAMTIEQYAALCAECSVHARWATEIAARYGVKSEAERRALDAHFRSKMADDPKLSETWRYHYARVEQWARQQKS